MNKVTKVTKEILKKIYQERPSECHKYDYGLLLVIGGSQFYSGSPALAALSAFKSGVDMVYVISPKRSADIIASFTPAIAAYPLEGDYLTKKHLSKLFCLVEGAKDVSHGKTAVVVGGGMGRSSETLNTILEFLENLTVPAVIDADAIYAVAKKPEIISGKSFVLTPHKYEFFVLTGKEVRTKKEEERIEIVYREAQKLNTNIILKGKVDIISNGKEVVINETGSPYLSKGGTGDTLAGICGAILARGVDPFLSAQAAAFINGKAGELAAEKFKESLLPTDLINEIPNVLKDI